MIKDEDGSSQGGGGSNGGSVTGSELGSEGWTPEIDYQSIFADASVPMAITRVDGKVIECNRRFEELSGYERDELVKLTLFNLIVAEELQDTFSHVARMLHGTAGEKPSPYSGRAVLKNSPQGSDAPVYHISLSLVHDYEDRPRYFSLTLGSGPPPPSQ